MNIHLKRNLNINIDLVSNILHKLTRVQLNPPFGNALKLQEEKLKVLIKNIIDISQGWYPNHLRNQLKNLT